MLLTSNKRLIIIILVAVSILLVPLIGMSLSDEINWQLGDFAVAGVLLIGSGLMIEFTLRKFLKTNHRIFIVLGILAILVLIYVELAVGLLEHIMSVG